MINNGTLISNNIRLYPFKCYGVASVTPQLKNQNPVHYEVCQCLNQQDPQVDTSIDLSAAFCLPGLLLLR